jgi:hypothetical protein
MKLFFVSIAFLLCYQPYAQEIKGRIVDDKDNILTGATIYFDGSTVGTLSRGDGTFNIEFKEQSNLTLVVRFLGFETFYLPNPDPKLNYEITLTPKENQLDEVVFDTSPFTREQMLRSFKHDFLGRTKAGRRARILNEDDIRFYYDKDEKSLYASARQPIQVINKELGYKVEFDLVDFISDFTRVTLDKDYQKTNYFGGTSFFKNIAEEDRRIKRKRLKAYKGSSMHFFKSLCSGHLEESKFKLFHKSFQVPASSVFEIKKVNRKVRASRALKVETYEDSYEITILGNDFENLNIDGILLKNKFQKKVALLHKDDRSDITFKTKVFYVDDYGNHTQINNILFSGEMSKGRLGNMLPINYLPHD